MHFFSARMMTKKYLSAYEKVIKMDKEGSLGHHGGFVRTLKKPAKFISKAQKDK